MMRGIPEDKTLHFLVGFLVAIFLFKKPTESFITVIFLAASKELYDYFHPMKHKAEWWDFFFTVFGWFIGSFIMGLFLEICHVVF